MTGNPHRAKPKPDLTPIARSGTGDKPQVNRFDRIERHTRQLKWLVSINLALSVALLVAGCGRPTWTPLRDEW
jgi:hypothetical protein